MKNHTDFIEKLPLEKREKFKTLIPEHQLLDIIVRAVNAAEIAHLSNTTSVTKLRDCLWELCLLFQACSARVMGCYSTIPSLKDSLAPFSFWGTTFALVNETRPAQIFIFLVCLGNSTITCKEMLSLLFCCGSRNFTCWVVSSLCLVVVSCCK